MSITNGPGSHFQGWCFSLPLAGQGEVEKANAVWPTASFELILLPLAGSATRVDVQATDAGHGRIALAVLLGHLRGTPMEQGVH